VEIIHEREFSTSDVIKMLKNSPQAPVCSPMPPQKCWSFIKTITTLESYLGDEKSWPEPLVTLRQQDKDLAFCALGMAVAFLQDALIDE